MHHVKLDPRRSIWVRAASISLTSTQPFVPGSNTTKSICDDGLRIRAHADHSSIGDDEYPYLAGPCQEVSTMGSTKVDDGEGGL